MGGASSFLFAPLRDESQRDAPLRDAPSPLTALQECHAECAACGWRNCRATASRVHAVWKIRAERCGEINLFALCCPLFQIDGIVGVELLNQCDDLRAHGGGGDQEALIWVRPGAVRGGTRHIDTHETCTISSATLWGVRANSRGELTHRAPSAVQSRPAAP